MCVLNIEKEAIAVLPTLIILKLVGFNLSWKTVLSPLRVYVFLAMLEFVISIPANLIKNGVKKVYQKKFDKSAKEPVC